MVLVDQERTKENVMVKNPRPLQNLPHDSKSSRYAEEQVTIPVDITVHLYRILFADRGETTTDDIQKKKEMQGSGT